MVTRVESPEALVPMRRKRGTLPEFSAE